MSLPATNISRALSLLTTFHPGSDAERIVFAIVRELLNEARIVLRETADKGHARATVTNTPNPDAIDIDQGEHLDEIDQTEQSKRAQMNGMAGYCPTPGGAHVPMGGGL